jgi:hypothetical protein
MRQKYGFVADVAPDASLSKTGPMSVRFSDVAEKDREADLNSLLIDVRCTTAASSVCARVCAKLDVARKPKVRSVTLQDFHYAQTTVLTGITGTFLCQGKRTGESNPICAQSWRGNP